jgi:hypothetical protein
LVRSTCESVVIGVTKAGKIPCSVSFTVGLLPMAYWVMQALRGKPFRLGFSV